MNKVHPTVVYSDETIVGLCICAKGLIQMRATTFGIFICYGHLSVLNYF